MVVKVALCQMAVTTDKQGNLKKAAAMIAEAARKGTHIAVLPEMFNCPYENDYFIKFAETDFGETVQYLAGIAKENNIMIIGGSIPEEAQGKIYNTTYVFNRSGEVIGKYRKMHLFDIDVQGGVRFMESDTLTAGQSVVVCDTEYGKIGLAICYDIRFPELSRLMVLQGAQMIILPGAFNMTTGPAHWSLSIRMRALDNQVFFVGVSPAREIQASYIAYGHSMIADPWGTILVEGGADEAILYSELDLELTEKIRQQLPLLAHRREDVYQLTYETVEQ